MIQVDEGFNMKKQNRLMVFYNNNSPNLSEECHSTTKEKDSDEVIRLEPQNIHGTNWGILMNEVFWIVQRPIHSPFQKKEGPETKTAVI